MIFKPNPMMAVPPGMVDMARRPYKTPILRIPSQLLPYTAPPQAPEAVDGYGTPEAPVGNDLPRRSLPEILMSLAIGDSYWHGSPSGELIPGRTGIHLGTKKAAQEALESRIGVPAEGTWDGTREYMKTMLMGSKRLGEFKKTGYNIDAPEDDYFPTKIPEYSSGVKISDVSRPNITQYKLIGDMSNSENNPHEDFRANGYMAAQLKRGRAKRGYYYRNVGEDAGSISIVVPSKEHLSIYAKDKSNKK